MIVAVEDSTGSGRILFSGLVTIDQLLAGQPRNQNLIPDRVKRPFFTTTISFPWLTPPTVQCRPGVFPKLQQPGRETERSYPSSCVKVEMRRYIPHSSIS